MYNRAQSYSLIYTVAWLIVIGQNLGLQHLFYMLLCNVRLLNPGLGLENQHSIKLRFLLPAATTRRPTNRPKMCLTLIVLTVTDITKFVAPLYTIAHSDQEEHIIFRKNTF